MLTRGNSQYGPTGLSHVFSMYVNDIAELHCTRTCIQYVREWYSRASLY